MFLKQFDNKKGTALYFMRSVRKNGKPTTEKVLFLGYLHDLQKEYEDPIAHFGDLAKKLTLEGAQNCKIQLEIDLNERYSIKKDEKEEEIPTDCIYNMGQFPLSVIYHELELDQFIKNRHKNWGIEANGEAIFRNLVFGRVLFPDSKLATWRKREKLLLGTSDFTDDDVYRFLPFLSQYYTDMIVHLNKKVDQMYKRDTSLMYYDVTNYFFDGPNPDYDLYDLDGNLVKEGLRKRGCSKEHRPEPIVQLGLFMDNQGLPVDFGIFPGNNNDVTTFVPMINRTREQLKLNKMIYVADKGMMSGTNIANILAQKQGYVISDSVRKQNKTMLKYIFDENGYTYTKKMMYSRDIHEELVKMDYEDKVEKEYKGEKNQKEEVVTFKYKSRLYPTGEYVWVDDGKKKVKVMINKRQIVFFSRDYQIRARIERKEAILKAKTSGTVFNGHAANKYFKKISYDPKTGMLYDSVEFDRGLDKDLIAADEQLDGYYLIETNVVGTSENERKWEGLARFRVYDQLFELNRPVSDQDIIEMYKGLWKIEESFRITKSYLQARPVYVRKQDSILAHFLTCFVALLILRILEIKKLNSKIPYTTMIESLRKAQLGDFKNNIYKNLYFDSTLHTIGIMTGLDLSKVYWTKQELRALNNQTKKV